MAGNGGSGEKEQWVKTIVDPQLRYEIEKSGSSGNPDDLMRGAFVLLERRIRESAGLAAHHFGKDLIDAAFHPQTGLLQPVSPVPAERAGLHHLLLGVFLYYRNPIAHRPVYYTSQSSRQVLYLIDHALELVRQATELAFNLGDFVGSHEGQILRRHDYRLDVDGDGQEDAVVLLELGPSMDEGKMVPHLAPIILKKGDTGFTRIPAEWTRGTSMYGPSGVQARRVTNLGRPDVIVTWYWGETMALVLTLRYKDGRYILARREIAPGTKEPYSGPHSNAFGVHPRQGLDFADVDGDGIDEMVQTLSFDPKDLIEMGYPNPAERAGERLVVCRLLKWDAQKELIVQVEERLIAEKPINDSNDE